MRFPRLFFLGLCFAFSAVVGTTQARRLSAQVGQIEEAIAKVRSSKTVDARTNAAEHLEAITQKIKSEEATDALVTKITALLDSPDDSVRYWVARALGNLGPAAKSAAPKLEEMLPKADCVNGAITSSSGIRYALIRMGIKPPPAPKCEPIAG
jgi:HEAT repeat protein